MEDGSPVYKRDDKSGKYIIIDDRKGTILFMIQGLLPFSQEMWSTNRKGAGEFYKEYGGPGVPMQITAPDGTLQTVNGQPFLRT